MFCETCADGTDLKPGDTCNVCKTTCKIIGYRKCEYPMIKEDEEYNIPITKIVKID